MTPKFHTTLRLQTLDNGTHWRLKYTPIHMLNQDSTPLHDSTPPFSTYLYNFRVVISTGRKQFLYLKTRPFHMLKICVHCSLTFTFKISVHCNLTFTFEIGVHCNLTFTFKIGVLCNLTFNCAFNCNSVNLLASYSKDWWFYFEVAQSSIYP